MDSTSYINHPAISLQYQEEEDDEESLEIREIKKREEELKRRMLEADGEVVQENGQRKYGGPPPNWEGPPPPKGCEVFVGRLPRDVSLEEIYSLFSPIAKIYELRLMMDFSGYNRGFCFIEFATKADAALAIEKMNDYELRPRHRIGVLKSVDNCRLFIGGLPKNKTREEIQAEMERLTEGVKECIVYSSIADKTKNRGFAFVEYVDHRAASKARRKLIPERLNLWGKEIAVDWAAPEPEIEDEIMTKVTNLYVRNLSLTTTEQALLEHFNRAGDGDVQRVKMMRDFAFVHFNSREKAEKAMQALNNTWFNGTTIEITWAKPKDKIKAASALASSASGRLNGNGSRPPSRKTSEGSIMSMSPRSSVFRPPPITLTPPKDPFNPRCFSAGPYSPLQQQQFQFPPISQSMPFMQPPLPNVSIPPPTHVSPATSAVSSLSSLPFAQGSANFSPLQLATHDFNGNRYVPPVVSESNAGGKPQRVRKAPIISMTDNVGPLGMYYPNFGPPLHAGHAQAWMSTSTDRVVTGTAPMNDPSQPPARRVSTSALDGLSAYMSRLNCDTRFTGINGNVSPNPGRYALPYTIMTPYSPRPMMP